MNKEMRKRDIKNLIKQYQEGIKFYRGLIDDLKRETSFMMGNYDKTWEEEYGHDVSKQKNDVSSEKAE